MRIENLLLQHFCQHSKLEVEFCPGLNVIVGPIGSGKSNILKGIRLVFANSSGNPGNLEEDIQYGIGESERSGVQLVGNHRESRFFIDRYLKPNSRKFHWENSPTRLTTERTIADEIQSRMGIDVNMIDEFLMIPQGKIADIIDMTDSNRVAAMQRLIGLQKYAKRYTWLGTYLTKLSVPPMPEDPETVAAELAELTGQLENARKSKALVVRVESADLIAANELIDKYKLATELSGRVVEGQAKAAGLEKNLAEIAGIIADLSSSIAIHQGNLQSARAAFEATKADVAAANDKALWHSVNAQIAQLKQTFTPPVVPANYLAPDDPYRLVIAGEARELAVMRQIKTLIDSGKKVCPTCFKEVEKGIPVDLSNMENLTARQAAFAAADSASRQYDVLLARQRDAARQANESLPKLEAKLASFPATIVNAPDKFMADSAYKAAEAKVRDAEARLQLAERNLSLARNQQASDSASLAATKASLEADTQGIAIGSIISSEAYQMALNVIANHNAGQLELARLDGVVAVLEKQIPLANERLAKAKANRKKAEANTAFRNDLATGRGLFHQDSLPFELAKSSMLTLAAKMNESLEAFSAQYRVSAGDGASFKAHFFNQDGKGVQSDCRLSGGERAQFGLALRVAAHSIWAQDLGFLALDEPTYGFGQGDMKCVAIAINQLRRLSEDQGLQIIVVTHEKSLLPLFDKVIQLGG